LAPFSFAASTPEAFYLDNGSAYSDDSLRLGCERLGVKRDYVDLHAILTMGGVSLGEKPILAPYVIKRMIIRAKYKGRWVKTRVRKNGFINFRWKL